MCRVCTHLTSLTARGATALLRSCSAPQALGHSAHSSAASVALQRWHHSCALWPALVPAQARRHLRPSSTFTAVSHSPRGFACRTKFDAPPPKVVLVEYDPNEVDSFIALADAVEEEFPDVQVEGNVEGVTPRRGAFEVTSADGGLLLFSRLQAGRGPNPGEVVDAIKLRVPGVGTIGNNGDFGGCT